MISPDGTITQTWRGGSSCFASARSVFAVDSTVRVVGLHLVAVALEPPRHPGAHAAEADHPDLHRELLQSQSDAAPAALLERREVAGRLRADQAREAEIPAGNRQLLADSSTTWTKSPVFGPPLCSWPVECR